MIIETRKKTLVQTLPSRKRIALIAHDGKKTDLIAWCLEHKDLLSEHHLCGTGTSARLVQEATGLAVEGYQSGPLGGDQQIGAQLVEGKIDMVIFFSDPLMAQPHDPDVKALLRITQVYDIPMANNKATADFLISSPYLGQEYAHEVEDFQAKVKERSESFQKEK